MDLTLFNAQQTFLAEKFAGQTLLVSGSTGLIGSRILRYLCGLNDAKSTSIQVIALYRNAQKREELFADLDGRDDVTFVCHEALQPLSYAGEVDYVIHCANISGGAKMHLKNPQLLIETAYEGTKHMLEFSVRHGVKGFCFVSSYEVYGNISRPELIPEDCPCELDTMALRNLHAELKRMCESISVAYASKSEMKVHVGRLTSTFGLGVKRDDPRFFAEFARCIADGKDIVLKSTGGTVRNYLDADDAATAFLYILAVGENAQAYNLTNMDNAISIREMAERMIALTGNRVSLRFDIAEDISKLGFRPESCTLVDASKLQALGWRPVYSLQDTLQKLMHNFGIA